MKEIERIQDQMRRAFEGEAWCGAALKETLANVTATRALRRPILAAHNIWEIVLHAAAWKEVICRRLNGEVVKTPAEGDYPPIDDASEAAWQATLKRLEERHRKLAAIIAGFPDSRLDEMTTQGGQVSVYQTLHGAIQHDLYHAAQIAVLKKSEI